MALRAIFSKLISGKYKFLFQKSEVFRKFATNVRLDKTEKVRLVSPKSHISAFSVPTVPQGRSLVSRLASRYYEETFVAGLRRRAALRFLVGPWGSRISTSPGFSRYTYLPTFALIGFSFLTQHPYLDSPQELDDVISDLQESFQGSHAKENPTEGVLIPNSWSEVEPVHFLDKGCNGAIFTARCYIKQQEDSSENPDEGNTGSSVSNTGASVSSVETSEVESQFGFCDSDSYYEDDFTILSERDDPVEVVTSVYEEWSDSDISVLSELDDYENSNPKVESQFDFTVSQDDFTILSERDGPVEVVTSENSSENPDEGIVLSNTGSSVSSVETSEESQYDFCDSESFYEDDFTILSERDGPVEVVTSVYEEESDSDVSILSDTEDDDNFNPEVNSTRNQQAEDALSSFSGKLDEVLDSQPSEAVCDRYVKNQPEIVVKYLFNYYVESNYSQLLQKFWNEAVPSHQISGQEKIDNWLTITHVKKKLPPHPNIVTMYNVFPGSIPDIPEAIQHFESALPKDQYPDSFGRNKTLCLVMKRYEMTLSHYLQTRNPSLKVRIMLFTQLLEGIRHMSDHQVAHRDLKTNNILLDCVPPDDSTDTCPQLVITDFGCCLADSTYGMRIPYLFEGTGKEGNMEHRAPEIINLEPGHNKFLDYSKADLWAAGVLAFEIFGISQHFDLQKRKGLSFPDTIPTVIKRLVENLLTEKPAERLDVATATNILHIYLWGWPAETGQRLKPFLLSLTRADHKETDVDVNLKKNFLQRLNADHLFDAITFVHPNWSLPVDIRKVIRQFPLYQTLVYSTLA